MVSQYPHCLNDLLFRNSIGELNLDVVAIVSNHPDLHGIADFYGIPFRHIPVTRETKPEAEAALLDIVRDEQVELVVLARYMQILSDELCAPLEGRAINIHHSMLPSFKGARPYHQAHARGVKFIGATAHYVTADLDEGPIIEQEMLRVNHSLSPEKLAARGREAETRALAHAVRWHTENRVSSTGTAPSSSSESPGRPDFLYRKSPRAGGLPVQKVRQGVRQASRARWRASKAASRGSRKAKWPSPSSSTRSTGSPAARAAAANCRDWTTPTVASAVPWISTCAAPAGSRARRSAVE